MRTVLLRELSCYTPEKLSQKLSLDLETTRSCIGSLAARGVLRLRSTGEQREYEDPSEDAAGQYQFVYVGLAVFSDVVIIVYPKYFKKSEPTLGELQQVFRVIRKSAGSFSEITATAEDGINSNSKLSLVLALLEMYGEYGIYTNYVKVLNQNGQGDISWERTIAKHSPFLDSDDTPIYFDFETVETARDVSAFVTRLHKCVLTHCSQILQECGLSELLSLDDIDLSDEDIEDFGDATLVNYRLEREHSVQFVTWKQDVIGLLRQFINDADSVVQVVDEVSLGTNAFYNVWEQACKTALDDKINHAIGSLGFHLTSRWATRSHDSLLSLIPSPVWHKGFAENETDCGDVATLIPDTISFWTSPEGRRVFGIFDAKYYVPSLGEKTTGVPGVESVTKQYLYQSAYRQFILDHGFNKVVNTFLIPTEKSEIEKRGRVDFPGVFAPEHEPFADDIALFALPAAKIWRCYLSDAALPPNELAELFD